MLDMFSPKQIQENVMSSTRNVWLAGLGAVASVEEESTQLFDQLVTRGRKVKERRQRQVEKTIETAGNEVESMIEQLSSSVEQRVASSLEKMAIPTRNQVRQLTDRVERLARLIEGMVVTSKTSAVEASAEKTPATNELDERKIYHVSSHEDGWKVQAEGGERASRVTETKAEAVAAARELAQNQAPSQVVVHRLDGTIQSHYSYDEPTETV